MIELVDEAFHVPDVKTMMENGEKTITTYDLNSKTTRCMFYTAVRFKPVPAYLSLKIMSYFEQPRVL